MKDCWLWFVPVVAITLGGCGNSSPSDDFDPPQTLRPDDPYVKATGCGMGPRVVRVHLGNLAGGYPQPLLRKLARQRLSNEVKCNAKTSTFLIDWSEGGLGFDVHQEYRYDRKHRMLVSVRTTGGVSVARPKPPEKQIYQHINDTFIHQQNY